MYVCMYKIVKNKKQSFSAFRLLSFSRNTQIVYKYTLYIVL